MQLRKLWLGLVLVWLLFCPAALAQELTVTEAARYTVDLAYMQTIAPGSTAWLYQPGTTINQPLMYSPIEDYYLNRRYTGSYHTNGALFTKEVPDFDAPVITLYGKNCMDNTLFGSLSLYREADYYAQNPTLYLLTDEGEYRLDIFAGIRLPLSEDWWQVQPSNESLRMILQNSFLTANPAFLPEEGDSWAILATEGEKGQRTRFVLYARKRPIRYTTDTVYDLHRHEMDLRQTQNGYATVEGVGTWMIYAQDDPVWDRLIFEAASSPKRRPFGDGGCGPTAVAVALASILTPEELTSLGQYALSENGYSFCTCSVNENFCNGLHLPYKMETPEQYLRYFPLAIASFATGNNTLEVQGRDSRYGTNMSYLETLCDAMNLSCEKARKLEDAIAFLKAGEGRMVVTSTSGTYSPFTDSSHFLALAGADDQYLYMIDPMRRDNYARWDPNGYLEIIQPGLVRTTFENAKHCCLGTFFLIKRPDPAAMPLPSKTQISEQ